MTLRVQGREVGPAQLGLIHQLLVEHPEWSRRRLSQELCQAWDWRNGTGRLKDMASRALLVKLQHRGLIELPARRRSPPNRMRSSRELRRWDQEPVVGSLGQLQPLQVREVSQDELARRELGCALAQFHYLGFGGAVGQNLQYVVHSGSGRLVACLVFGSAAWRCAPRDEFIGWTACQRQRNLGYITNNARFLILPWVRVEHLASWCLGAVLRRLSQDWQAKYGHGIELVETFVQSDRFRGIAYEAANWIGVGKTTGRTRQDQSRTIQAPVKEVYLYPLGRRFRERLAA